MAGVLALLGVRELERLLAFLWCWLVDRADEIMRIAMLGSDGGREFLLLCVGRFDWE